MCLHLYKKQKPRPEGNGRGLHARSRLRITERGARNLGVSAACPPLPDHPNVAVPAVGAGAGRWRLSSCIVAERPHGSKPHGEQLDFGDGDVRTLAGTGRGCPECAGFTAPATGFDCAR